MDRVHPLAVTAILALTAVASLCAPAAGNALQAWSGALLLVGGALIGVPHGSSDVVAAHGLLRPALGRRWLPVFVSAYLVLVAATMAAWAFLPLSTLLAFLVVSGLHFGWGDARASASRCRPGLVVAVRATTPLLPIFLIHPAGVAWFVAALGGVPDNVVLCLLDTMRWPLLLPWATALAAVALPPLLDAAGQRDERREAGELVAVALAAAVLPPLLAFGLYFCLVHAIRHMVELAHRHHPYRPAAAIRLVAAIVLPSAAICLLALDLTWGAWAGTVETDILVTWGLRLLAALTVHHMILEAMVARRVKGA